MNVPPDTESTTIEDKELMEALVQQNSLALERLHQRYKAILKAIILQVLHDESDAEDVLQDVFIQVWKQAKNYSSEKGKLCNWLATLARRRAIDLVRQHSAYRRATGRYEVAYNCLHKIRDEGRTVEQIQQRDLKELMEYYLRRLPISQRQVIHMTFFQGKSQREISSLTGTPLGTVKTRIELAIKKLAHAIGGMREKIL